MQYNKLTDDELYGLMKYGDTTAFNTIYDRHWNKVYSTAHKRLNNAEQCTEIVQDIFTELWTKRDHKQIENLKSYLRVAGKYQVYAVYRREKGNPKFEEPLEEMATDSLQADSLQNEKDLRKLIAEWMSTQPAKRRDIINLKFNEEMGTKEISLKLGITQKTVQNQLITAYSSLREYIRTMM